MSARVDSGGMGGIGSGGWRGCRGGVDAVAGLGGLDERQDGVDLSETLPLDFTIERELWVKVQGQTKGLQRG